MPFCGKVWQYGDDVNTDVIIPARYLNISRPEELAQHSMEDLDPTFIKEMRPGDIIVAGSNFGCGSSREHAPLALKASGIACVVASSFARIFYRNSINIGLPILETSDAPSLASKGDELEVNLETGVIKNLTTGKSYQANPYPEFMLGIMRAGGLIEYTKEKLGV